MSGRASPWLVHARRDNGATVRAPHGRVTSVAQGDRTASYSYDARGRVATQTDAGGRVTTYAYDAGDRPVSETGPGGTVSFEYDARVA
jgi:YD repeat-containing protein